ncbi:MAG: hypothetical protein ACI9J3_001897 [Parvicellaceae bacterium]|jgi:hypothetical protein
MNQYFVLSLLILIGLSCASPSYDTVAVESSNEVLQDTIKLNTAPSTLDNTYIGFNSPNAINHIANIENSYFTDFKGSFSKYYGTVWRSGAEEEYDIDSISTYEQYLNEMKILGQAPDSMHCTIYAIKGLMTGLDSSFNKLDSLHRKVYKNHEHAGWSIGYLLVKYFDWKAYVVVNQSSKEYDRCKKYFAKNKTYYVWNQPDIPVERLYDYDEDAAQLDSLLKQNEFGWGFSEQGWHTWITRFNSLKECIWNGAPSNQYSQETEGNLFRTTPFATYTDYNSHVIVFPPKQD